jgi:hypothetical protein
MTEHLLTGAAPCTSAARGSDGDGSDACGNKQPNALYRPVIDQPGQRFALSDQLSYSLSASATAQF